jgi:hypothetical protein
MLKTLSAYFGVSGYGEEAALIAAGYCCFEEWQMVGDGEAVR